MKAIQCVYGLAMIHAISGCGQYTQKNANNGTSQAVASSEPEAEQGRFSRSDLSKSRYYESNIQNESENISNSVDEMVENFDTLQENTIERKVAAVNSTNLGLKLRPLDSFVYAINPKSKWSGTPKVLFVDLFDTSQAKIATYKSKGQSVICYFSAGTRESWRPDKSKFPASSLGKKMPEWAGENWIDYRNAAVKALMKARIDLAKSKGCQGVDPDNIDGHLNASGFPLKSADQKNYISFLADAAKAQGLIIGLKNSAETAAKLEPLVDFAVVEECHAYNECGAYSAFAKNAKAVFQVEYRAKTSSLCSKAKAAKATLIFSDYDLKSFSACL